MRRQRKVGVDSRQRPAAHTSAWRSGTGRQLTRIVTSPASASTTTAYTSGTSRRGRADAHGANAGRPVRVCAAEHARRAPLRAPRPGPAYFVTTLNLLRSRINITAPKLMSPHFNLLKCRRLTTAATSQVQNALVRPPRRLPDAEVSDAPRAYHAANGGAPTRTSWEQLFW
ncbi:hypothetical protein EVAR_11162_1 [Eumeta japonica]|uniref:Uncharacterized protein n=1 Tax=Eumeta variegata TaxID=151549 RepID=A0A4C1U4A3_EUMVA|nr:hypothetical protein EVAR_11162_1 [Eumeta japonica]